MICVAAWSVHAPLAPHAPPITCLHGRQHLPQYCTDRGHGCPPSSSHDSRTGPLVFSHREQRSDGIGALRFFALMGAAPRPFLLAPQRGRLPSVTERHGRPGRGRAKRVRVGLQGIRGVREEQGFPGVHGSGNAWICITFECPLPIVVTGEQDDHSRELDAPEEFAGISASCWCGSMAFINAFRVG